MNLKQIVTEFKGGLSMVGLARKYGRKKIQIEAIIRRWMKRQKQS